MLVWCPSPEGKKNFAINKKQTQIWSKFDKHQMVTSGSSWPFQVPRNRRRQRDSHLTSNTSRYVCSGIKISTIRVRPSVHGLYKYYTSSLTLIGITDDILILQLNLFHDLSKQTYEILMPTMFTGIISPNANPIYSVLYAISIPYVNLCFISSYVTVSFKPRLG